MGGRVFSARSRPLSAFRFPLFIYHLALIIYHLFPPYPFTRSAADALRYLAYLPVTIS